jgi:heat shock protein HslJ
MLVDLAGGAWRAEQIDGIAALPEAQCTLRFEARERVSGSTGCSLFRGAVSSQGDTIAFGSIATTRGSCAEPLREQEERYLAALASARSLRRDGKRLLLIDDNGTLRLRFAPAGSTSPAAGPGPG